MQLKLLQQILQEKCKLLPEKITVIGISGGADSLSMLSILSKFGYRLIVAHFDHQLRSESGGDAEFVREAARKYDIEFVLGNGDVRRYALENKKTIEEAARILRYKFLLDVARQRSAQAVAVAHNADDQVETILMHLIRGAGVSGLCGMNYWDDRIFPDQTVPIVRPFLGTWRREIDDYCKENQIIPREDLTNSDTRYTRNRIRHEVLKNLEAGNPQFKEQLFQTGEIIKAENDLVSALTMDYLAKIEIYNNGSGYAWDKKIFLSSPLAIQRRLIYWVLARFQKNTDNINFNMVEQVLQFIVGSSRSHQIMPVNDLQIYMHRGIVYFLTTHGETDTTIYPACMPLLIAEKQKKYTLMGNWELSIDPVEKTELLDFTNIHKYECWMDADRILWPLELRPAILGERIKLMGMAGHSKKINDYLTDRHVPAQYRKTWPVLCCSQQVIWVAGSQPAETVSVSPETKKIIHLRIYKVDDKA